MAVSARTVEYRVPVCADGVDIGAAVDQQLQYLGIAGAGRVVDGIVAAPVDGCGQLRVQDEERPNALSIRKEQGCQELAGEVVLGLERGPPAPRTGSGVP